MSTGVTKQGIVYGSGQEISANLLKNSNFATTYQQTTGWDTSKNGTTLASNWGGYNSGVPNPSTVYHAHMVQFQGEWVYVYIRTSAESWLGISQSGLQSSISPNTTYTWSIQEYRVSGSNNYITAGIYYKRNSSDSNGFWSGCSHGTGEDAFNKWVTRYYTFTTGDVYTSSSITMYIYGHEGGTGTVYMRRPKLEVGSLPTSWELTNAEGYSITNHGFTEDPDVINAQFAKNYINATDFIEI